MKDLISRAFMKSLGAKCIAARDKRTNELIAIIGIDELPPAQPEDYTELKREFLRMASYIDVLLECSDDQKETVMGFISRLSQYMPWTERD